MSISSNIYENVGKAGATLAIIASITAGFGSFVFEKTLLDEKVVSTIISSRQITSDIIDLDSRVQNISAQLEGLKSLPTDIPVSSKITEIEARLNIINQKLDSLQKTILESPEKALALPLIRRDIDSLQKQHLAAIANVEKEVTRAYDIFKWVTGSIALGIVSLAVGVFGKQKQ